MNLTCNHLLITYCEYCGVFCENCGFDFSNDEEWDMELETADNVIRRNYICGCEDD
ncbi:unnamed protein product [marine sediment metagenome]|uniref:Uncharacterized protein n=1 Tax=marine sediment metagenome TaxID=412755 RepID=X0W507_9ZZZZ